MPPTLAAPARCPAYRLDHDKGEHDDQQPSERGVGLPQAVAVPTLERFPCAIDVGFGPTLETEVR